VSELWKRNTSYRWPSDNPAWTYGVFFTSLVLVLAGLWMTYERFTPLQQYWLPTYLSANIMRRFGVTKSKYRLLAVAWPDKTYRLPAEDEVEPGITRNADGRQIPFALTEQAQLDGKRLTLRPPQLFDNEVVQDKLRTVVYQDQTLTDLAWWPLMAGAAFLSGGLSVAIPQDKKRADIRKFGRRLRGPELVTAAEFNRRNKSDGIGFVTLEKPRLSERLLWWRREWERVRIPRSLENSHLLITADTGKGKTVAARQVLIQVADRGETAVVYDPGLDYTGQFYTPERGDVILNPLDLRMPPWSPAEEVTHPAEALTLATSLFPDKIGDNPFFAEGARKIVAHLLNLKPTPEELVFWLSDEGELERRLKGSKMSGMIYKEAGNQRGGFLGSLGMVADSLKLLPSRAEARSRWTAAEWSKHRKGWLFITSIPEAREHLRPLISMWLDMLILRLMNQGQPGPRPVWFLLDELATLHKLPQLGTALTENRRSNNPVVLCFQGRSQIQALYGHQAEAMFSQPATKIFLGTSEPNAAQWISDTIGNVEMERLVESRTDSQMPPYRESRTCHVEREVTPLVMKEEIAGLAKGHGFLKCGNLVVQISFPYIGLPKNYPDFILRQPKPAIPEVIKPAPRPDDDRRQDEEGPPLPDPFFK